MDEARESILDLEGADRGSSLPLLEREREVERLGTLLKHARDGRGAVAAIQGPAGIGKSRLLNAAINEARGGGFEVLVARGGELEQGVSWGVARELFGQIVADPDAQQGRPLLVGAAALAGPALGIHSPDVLPAGPDAAGSALHGLYWLASDLCERRPVMLAVDDVHWVDLPSLRLIGYLSRRVDDLPLVIVVAGRPVAPGPEAELTARALANAEILRPGALSEEGASELVDRILGSEPEPEFVRACHEVTGGNPFLLRELCLELRREGTDGRAAGVAHVRDARPEAIRQAVLLRLSPLPRDARDLAAAAAVLGREATLTNAAELAELSAYAAAEAADLLESAAILARGVPLTFVHPIVRSVVYEGIAPAHRARLHARAMELLEDSGAEPESVAAQALAVEGKGDESVVEVLRAAAREALSGGAPANAVAYLRRALEEPPRPDGRAALLIELAEAEALAGHEIATARLEEALPLLDDPPQRAAAHVRLGSLLHRAGRPAEAAAQLARGIEAAQGNEELEAELRAGHLAVAMLVDLPIAELEARIEEIDERPARELTATERERFAYQALARVIASRDHESAARLAAWALDDGRWLREKGPTPSLVFTGASLFWSDAFRDADDVIEGAREWGEARGDFTTRAYALFGRCRPSYWRGLLAQAASDALTAIETWRTSWSVHLPLAGVWAAMALIELDELDEAEAVLEASWPRFGAAPVYEASQRSARGRILMARGDSDAALEEFRAAEVLADGIPYLQTPATDPWRSDAARAALASGAIEDAKRLATEELRLAERFGAPRPLGISLRTMGLVEGDDEGLRLLRESVSVLERSPATFELCQSLLELGSALRRSGHRKESREHLRRSLALADEFGACRVQRRAHEELEASGARMGRIELSGPNSLTPSERRVAELAAGGATNREIAQQLFVSLRTIETHLTHAYQKLDISSRRELADAMRADSGSRP